ncbi:ACT domain-containing protein [Hirsutella rhossiliensis]|uniref:ACT domain-containing protein n=1 Tax=Hirsutella rhossiliensis TaxID=111463 RepID=A0A9P8MS16_9HYPO|nr:ACT domain-containing protein [Hirsutella rhossiliensis]KAH0960220.1 ACT domain-containing protein [Hirsutella rhossiliensis]
MEPTMADPGEKCLAKLLSTLTTTLHPSTYVFATLGPDSPLPPLAEIQLLFRETEGVTLVVSLDFAQAQKMQYFFPCKMITLNVTSSLEAVGFMAIIATRLAACNMGVNPVSGFYHDHLFVPTGREAEAVEVLAALAEEKKSEQLNDA